MGEIVLGTATTGKARSQRRRSIEELAEEIRKTGHSVTIEEQEEAHVWRWELLSPIEQLGILILSGVPSAIGSDIYTMAKRWARKQFKKSPPRPQRFTIYGPDGKVLGSFKIDQNGEDEHKIDESEDE